MKTQRELRRDQDVQYGRSVTVVFFTCVLITDSVPSLSSAGSMPGAVCKSTTGRCSSVSSFTNTQVDPKYI